MRRTAVALWGLSVAVAGRPAPCAGQASVAERAAAFVESVRQEWGAPGVSAAVALDGRIVFAEGAGWADLRDSVPARPETVYRIASTSKAITATAVLQLVERGVVGLDDDVRRYVPEFPSKRWPVTVRQLLTHTSGVRHYRQGETSRKTEHYASVADAISLFAGDSLLFEPGSQYHYSTYGYTLLQGVIEAAAGMPFREYLRRNVWRRAEMSRSDLEVRGEAYPHRATGYNRPGGDARPVPLDDVSFKYAGGGMLSTTADLVRFCSALFADRLLSAAWSAESMTPQIPDLNGEIAWAWGTRLDSLRRRVVWHPGRSFGFESQLLCYPDQRLAVAVLTNQDWTDPWRQVGGLADFLAHIFMPETDVPVEAVATGPAATATLRALEAGGLDSATAVYGTYLANPHYRYGSPAVDLDALGRRLLGEGRLDDGAALLQLNATLHPDAWLAWVSAGDAALAGGAMAQAEEAYRRVLTLHADAPETRRKLGWLEERGAAASFDPTGGWHLETTVDVGGREQALDLRLDLTRDGGRLSGTLTSDLSGTTPVHTAVATGDRLWVVSAIQDGLLELELTVTGADAVGRWLLGPQSGRVTGRRVAP
jgi:CubicO group peptidase (beta-lactamase class C family)